MTSDHESSTDVGWLLYSTHQQDAERLSALLSTLTGETLGVKWKPVCTTEGFTKRDPSAVIVQALHIKGPSDCVRLEQNWQYGIAPPKNFS